MSSTQLAPDVVFRSWTNNGQPNNGGSLYTYVAGTSTPQATYTDSTGLTQNTNPVIFNSRGEANVWLTPGLAYKLVQFDAFGTQLVSVDNVLGPLLSIVDYTQIKYDQTPAELAASVTPINYYYQPGDVRRYGAVPGTDCTAIVTTAASCNFLVFFSFISSTAWVINSTPTIPNGVLLEALPGSTFSGAGAASLALPTTNTVGFQFTDFNPLAPHSGVGELASFNYFRNATSTVTASGVANAVRIQTNVAAGVQNFEWGFLSILNNSATGGQNVAGYFQANKNGNIGPTWGAVIQINETVAINGPTAGTVALEIDQLGNGTDTTGGNRVGIDLVIEKYNNSGAGYVCTWGYRCSAGISDAGASKVGFGFGFTPGSYAIVGFDTSHATIATASIQMAQGQGIIFDGPTTQANALVYDGTGLSYKVSGTVETRLLATGGVAVNTSGVATQVLSQRISGYGTPTGGSRISNFPGATATLLQTSEMLAQLMVDLQTHGMIGS